MKKLLLLVLVSMMCLSTACGISGSAPSSDSPNASASNKTFTIAMPTWTGYGPLFLAKEKGFFQKHGVNINLTIVEGLAERKQALASGKIHGLATAADVQVNLAANSIPVGILWVLDASNGSDGIIAKKEIKTPKDLKGKKVAVEVGTTSHLFLLKVLEQAGLTDKDIEIIQMNAGDAGSAYVAGKVDAAVTYDPWLSRGVAAGGNAFTTKEYPIQLVDTVSFTKDVIKNNPDQMKGFVAAMTEAYQYWKEHEAESVAIMAKGLKIGEDEFKDTVSKLKLYDLSGNKEQMGTADKPGTIYNTVKEEAEFYVQQKIIDKAPDITQLIEPSFVRDLKQ